MSAKECHWNVVVMKSPPANPLCQYCTSVQYLHVVLCTAPNFIFLLPYLLSNLHLYIPLSSTQTLVPLVSPSLHLTLLLVPRSLTHTYSSSYTLHCSSPVLGLTSLGPCHLSEVCSDRADMGEPVPEESHGSPGDSLWVDVPATQDSLELPPLPPSAPTEAETLPSSKAMNTVEHPVDGQDGESAAEQERTALHQAGEWFLMTDPGQEAPECSQPHDGREAHLPWLSPSVIVCTGPTHATQSDELPAFIQPRLHQHLNARPHAGQHPRDLAIHRDPPRSSECFEVPREQSSSNISPGSSTPHEPLPSKSARAD